MRWVFNDGGRKAAGIKDTRHDCVIRAIAIAAKCPYKKVFKDLYGGASMGVPRTVYEPYILSLGFVWTPTMLIGGGCKVHMRADELPRGTLIVRVSRHLCAVIDGVVHDTHDPSRDEGRCVYGYFQRQEW